MLAIHDPLLRVSQAGLVLTYSILGEADQLMGAEVRSWIRLRRLGRGPGPFTCRPWKWTPILLPFAGLEQGAWWGMRVRAGATAKGDEFTSVSRREPAGPLSSPNPAL